MANRVTITFLLGFAFILIHFVTSQAPTPEEINDKLTKAKEASTAFQTFLETIAKDAKDITDNDFAQKAIQKLLPFIKNLGPIFAFAALFFEQEDRALTEMKNQFKIINGRFNRVDQQLKNLRHEMKEISINEWYDSTIKPIAQVEHNVNASANPNATASQKKYYSNKLHEECVQSDPENFLVEVRRKLLETFTSPNFRETISKDYDKRKIRNWITIITIDAARAMSAHQACLGVRPDLKSPTDVEEISNNDVNTANNSLNAVLAALNSDLERVIKDWQEQLDMDIKDLTTEHGFSQALVKKELKAKYDWIDFNAYYLHGTLNQRIIDKSHLKAHSDDDKTMLVFWLLKQEHDQDQKETQIKDYIKSFKCANNCGSIYDFNSVADKLKEKGAKAVFVADLVVEPKITPGRPPEWPNLSVKAAMRQYSRKELCMRCALIGSNYYQRTLVVSY